MTMIPLKLYTNGILILVVKIAHTVKVLSIKAFTEIFNQLEFFIDSIIKKTPYNIRIKIVYCCKMSSRIEANLTARNILQLSTKEKRQFMDSFDYVFSDIDGVIWNLEHDVPGAADGFNQLKNAGKNVTFITNNSVRTVASCVKMFKNQGLDVKESEIIHPAQSIVNYLKKIKFEGLIYIIASENFKNVIRTAGYEMIEGPTEIIPESYRVVAGHIFDRQPVRAVIIDFDFNLSSLKLIRAHVYLQNPECLLIAGATDMLLPVHSDMSVIGPGAFAKVLAESSCKEMIALGKPGKDLVHMLIERYSFKNTKRVLMIGDMLEQDVGFGKECGFQTLVVLTGGCNFKDLHTLTNPGFMPDYYAESVADFTEFMNDLNK